VEVTGGGGFWRGRSVLVTGVTGFKGSWLALLLAGREAKVKGFALAPPTKPSLFECAMLGSRIDWTHGDVRSIEEVTGAFKKYEPEIVFHLAAQPLVRASYAAPVETFGTNVMGTVHVLEAARRSQHAKVVVVVTSDKCYEDRGGGGGGTAGYTEDDRLGGHDPYATSKACAELVATAYRRSFSEAGGPTIVTARAGNVIGGGDWAKDRIVPDVVTALAARRPAVIRNPRCVRPWQHVLDPLAGYLRLAERAHEARARHELASAWNFGPSPESMRPVSNLAGEICRLWGGGARWQPPEGRSGEPEPHETGILTLDSAMARRTLGWAPVLPYDEAVEWTTDWYRIVLGGGSARLRTVRQVQEFEERAA